MIISIQILLFEVFYELLSALETIQTFVDSTVFIHIAIQVHDSDNREMVAQTALIVIHIMTRCDLYSTTALQRVHQNIVLDDRNHLVGDRTSYLMVHKRLVIRS